MAWIRMRMRVDGSDLGRKGEREEGRKDELKDELLTYYPIRKKGAAGRGNNFP